MRKTLRLLGPLPPPAATSCPRGGCPGPGKAHAGLGGGGGSSRSRVPGCPSAGMASVSCQGRGVGSGCHPQACASCLTPRKRGQPCLRSPGPRGGNGGRVTCSPGGGAPAWAEGQDRVPGASWKGCPLRSPDGPGVRLPVPRPAGPPRAPRAQAPEHMLLPFSVPTPSCSSVSPRGRLSTRWPPASS